MKVKQWPNYSIHWPAGPVLRKFAQHLIALCSLHEAAGDVISSRCVWPIVPDKRVKFRDPRLNRSQEIPLEAAFSTVFFTMTFDPEVANDVKSDVAVE